MQFVIILIYWFAIHSIYCKAVKEYCVSKVCTKISALLLRNMDQNADPCNDFFQYACGNWVQENPLPEGVPIKSQSRDLEQQILMEWNSTLLDETKLYKGPILLARIMLQSCLNRNNRDNVRKPFLEFMTNHGGMPLIHDPDNKKVYNCTNPKAMSSLLATNYHLTFLTMGQRGPISPFFTVITKKAFNASYVTLAIKLPRELVLKCIDKPDGIYWHEFPQIILIAMQYLAGNFVPTAAQINAAKLLKNFAYTIWNYRYLYNTRNVGTMTLIDLKDLFPHLDWNDYLETLLPKNMAKSDDTVIETSAEEYNIIKAISEFFNLQVQAGHCRVILNYIWFSTMYALFHELAMDHDIYKVFVGGEHTSPLKSEQQMCCDNVIQGHMDQAVGALYVQENFKFNDNEKNGMNNMVANIKAEMIENLQKADWLDTQTKLEALAKTETMREFLVYPDMAQRQNNDLLEQYYANLSFTNKSSYFAIIKAVNSYGLKKHFQVLVDSSLKKDWTASPAKVNAHYMFQENSITVDAAILNPPFFYTNGPKSMNYGGIGFVVGHEITHGFDNIGRLFDEDGDRRNWWQTESNIRFMNKSACFIGQYGSLKTGYVNVTLDGKKTLGENIADAGGIKMAYRAYRKYIQKLGKEEPRLPGLMHLTNDQLFFISSAQGWCGTSTKEGLQRQIHDDKHAFQKFRIGMQMMNSKDFQRHFQCREGMELNPDKQCHIWLL